ncbi:MAG: DUF427 domain-containing protein [Actinomycetota bacterium]|nr:DUF427 domain-containing protein [Actinomycetota bacterium]
MESANQRGRLRTEPSHKRVRAYLGQEPVADTKHPLLVWEIPYCPRWRTCAWTWRHRRTPRATAPYKGTGSYWHLDVNGKRYEDVVWMYRTPLPESQKIGGLAALYNEKVDMHLDGEPPGKATDPFQLSGRLGFTRSSPRRPTSR